ncbi:MAG TPA: metallophosphoesterase [Bacillota bacterium]|nr:metallophosphoesterase [Bacillota bacterium]
MKKPLLLAVATLVLFGMVGMGCHSHPTARKAPQSFDFVQMCDPQIGFSDYATDLGRFEESVKQINARHPDFVVICGDLVNGASQKSFTDFNAAKARLTIPCYCAPGNHDEGNTPTRQTLERYRKYEGKDYFSFEHKGCTFIVVNTQLWKAPLPGESEQHDAWVKKTLVAAAKKHQPIFIISHYPLFEKTADEPDAYFNLPLAKRQELLELFKRCGVVAMLSGHTHKTLIQNADGIQMVTSETTSRNFDNRPFGFRIWHVGPTRPYQHEFVPLQ